METILDVWSDLLQERVKINGVKQKKPIPPTPPRNKQSRNSIAGGLGDDEHSLTKKSGSKKAAAQQEELTVKEAIKLTYSSVSKFSK